LNSTRANYYITGYVNILSVTPATCVEFMKQVARVTRNKLADCKLRATTLRSSWEVALRPGCGHCPAHSHFGREQCYAAQAASAFFVFDTKQERMPSPQRVTIIALAYEGDDAARHRKGTFPSATKALVSSRLVHHSTNRWIVWQ